MKNHLLVLSVLHMVAGVIELLIGAVVLIGVAGGGLLSGDPTAIGVTSLVGFAVGALFGIMGLPSILGGLGLYYGKSWARILLIIVGLLSLLNAPIGTIIGAYTLWVLTRGEAAELLDGSHDLHAAAPTP